MIFSNIKLGDHIEIDNTATFNDVVIHDNVKIAKFCSVFGSKDIPVVIGKDSYIGKYSIINGFGATMQIGERVSIAQKVNVMTESGPNRSPLLQKLYPVERGPVKIGNDCWIVTDVIIMPNVELGDFCVVAADRYTN
jgi:galactoside O-acetyltransferase